MGMDTLESIGTAVMAASLTDAEIVRRVRAGERALFEILMRRHNQRVYRTARAVLKDEREVDFILLRQKIAAGQPWVGALHDEIQPKAKKG